MTPASARKIERLASDGSALASWEIGRWGGASQLDPRASPAPAPPSKMTLLGESAWALSPLAIEFFEKLWSGQDQAFGGAVPGKMRLGGQVTVGPTKEIEALAKKSAANFKRDYAGVAQNPFKMDMKAAIAQARLASPPSASLVSAWFCLSVFELNNGLCALVTHQSRKIAKALLSDEQLCALAPGSKTLGFGVTQKAMRLRVLGELADRLEEERSQGAPESGLSWMEAFEALDAVFGFSVSSLAQQGESADPKGKRAKTVMACKALVERKAIGAATLQEGQSAPRAGGARL